MHKVTSGLEGYQFVPELPLPRKVSDGRVSIRFTRDDAEVKKVSKYLFDDESEIPSKVGETCFDRTLKAARRS